MSDSPSEVIRHALRTAREYGFRRVKLEGDGVSFKATLLDDVEMPVPVVDVVAEAPARAPVAEVAAPVVGYYREGPEPLRVGRKVSSGEALASIVALGLANDVESPSDGTIVEVLVSADQPVEYGQVLARIERGGD